MKENKTKRDMLYVVPVMPNHSGGGREMRALAWICHLSERFAIHLVVAMPECKPSALLLDKIASVHFVQPVFEKKRDKIVQFLLFALGLRKSPPIPHTMGISLTNLKKLAGALSGFSMDYILVFRAGMVALGMGLNDFLKPRQFDLDMDDIESSTHFSLANIHFKNNNFLNAAHELTRAILFFFVERNFLKKFENIYVCAGNDRDYLGKAYHLQNIAIFPNQILFHEFSPGIQDRPVFLFVGQLDYFPNEDAARFLSKRILPGLKKAMRVPFNIIIAGRKAPKRLEWFLSNLGEVEYLGEVEDMSAVYKQAGIAIIPLRAGGGTKLKVLEAFLHQVPVIASEIAVRGLDVVDKEHFLLCSSTQDYISACCRLSNDPALADTLRKNAYQWVLNNRTYHITQG